jgi:hypothetical protein
MHTVLLPVKLREEPAGMKHGCACRVTVDISPCVSGGGQMYAMLLPLKLDDSTSRYHSLMLHLFHSSCCNRVVTTGMK